MPDASWVDIDSITPWDKNPRINDHAVDDVVKSIKRFGWSNPIIVRKADKVVIAGHTRLKAAKKMGLDKVLVREMDLDPAQAAALALADNKLNEIADWDDESLGEILLGLEQENFDLDGLGFSDDELKDLLSGVDESDFGPAKEMAGGDDAPEVDEEGEPDSKLGEVYELGHHRLVCGDSTKAETFEVLMGGEKADMVWTDPPYGVSFSTDHLREWDGGKKRERKASGIKNDSLEDEALFGFLLSALGAMLDHTKDGGVWYVAAPAGRSMYEFARVLGRHELDVWKHTLSWVKNTFVLGRCDFHYKHETIFYGWKPGSGHYWAGRRDLHSCPEFPKPQKNPDHPTMKPVELIEFFVEQSSKKGWVVCDPFGGSGSTLIAAAKTGRVARLIELDPKYCDVIRRRWTKFAKENGLEVGSGGLE